MRSDSRNRLRHRLGLGGMALALAAGLLAEPIRLHPDNPRYFLFQGKPTVLISSGEHYGAVLNADFDYLRYLRALRAAGMNYTRLFSGAYVEKPGAFGIQRNNLAPAGERFLPPWARSDSPGYASGGNRFDLNRWNPEYFARLKEFMTEAARRGIVVELTFFSSLYEDTQWAVSPFNASNNVNRTTPIDRRALHTLDNGNLLGFQESMVRRMARELNGFDNLIYEIQNEPWSDRTVVADTLNPYLRPPALKQWPNSVDLADGPSLQWQAAMAACVTGEEARLPKRHLLAQNLCNFRTPVRHLLPGVSIVNFHYAFPEAVTWNLGLGKLIAYDESGFLGASDSVYRRQAWHFLLAGGGLFNNLDYSFTVGFEDGTDPAANGPGGGSPALRQQLKVLSDFMHSLSFVTMAPDPGVVKRAPGVLTRALAKRGQAYAIYVEGGPRCTLELELPAGKYQARWVNTLTGQVDREEEFMHAGGMRSLSSPAYAEDIALRVARKAK